MPAMAFPFRCPIREQAGIIKDFRGEKYIKSHLGGPTVHNMGPYVCMYPDCEVRTNRLDRTTKHSDVDGAHHPIWAEDSLLLAKIMVQVKAGCLVDDYPPDHEDVDNSLSAHKDADGSLTAHKNIGHGEDNDSEDDSDDDAAPKAISGSFDEELFGDGTSENPNFAVKITGIPLREEIFELLLEVIEAELETCRSKELVREWEDLKASLDGLRQACFFADLLALVRSLAKVSKSQASLNVLSVVYTEIKKTFVLDPKDVSFKYE